MKIWLLKSGAYGQIEMQKRFRIFFLLFCRDFDPAETVGEKMTKFFDVKGVKGFKKLMKEIAVTASTGKHDNELIGRCNIPLRVSE